MALVLMVLVLMEPGHLELGQMVLVLMEPGHLELGQMVPEQMVLERLGLEH